MNDKLLTGEFSWAMLGNINEGRKHLGNGMLVAVYRLFQYTMRAVLVRNFGVDEMTRLFREFGELAGKEYAHNMVDMSLPLDQFSAQLQAVMREMQIGVLRFEMFDDKTGKAIMTVGEDLDCSGLPVSGECVCNYDEGFIAGILSEYTDQPYSVIEVDCWAKGDRVCRFEANRK